MARHHRAAAHRRRVRRAVRRILLGGAVSDRGRARDRRLVGRARRRPAARRRLREVLRREAGVLHRGDTAFDRRCKTDRPTEVGSDLVAGAIGAVAFVGAPAIVINYGTATTFGAIDADGAYLGVAIATGLQVSLDALVGRTAKLPQVALVAPGTAIGRDTVSAIQAGLVYGAVGQTEELVRRMRALLGESARVIASGGMAPVVAAETSVIERVEPHLVLHGLRVDYLR